MSTQYNTISNVPVATFNTEWKNQSANQPLASLAVAITPTQDTSGGNPSPTNVCPISGKTGATARITAKNLLPCPYSDGTTKTLYGITYTVQDDGTVLANGICSGGNSVFQLSTNAAEGLNFLNSGSYTVNGMPTDSSTSKYYIQMRVNGTWRDAVSPLTFNYNSEGGGVNTCRIRIMNGTVCNNVLFKPMIRFSSVTDDTYEPYNGKSYPVSWGSVAGTVYGGSFDFVSGTLTVTMANIASYNGETIGEPWFSSMDVYSPGATPTTGAQVVYTLATPLTYQFTANQIKTLLGVNNVYADAGNVTVKYQYEVFDLLRVFINGYEITHLIAFGGWQRERSDVDSPDAGRTLDATMHRARVATKMRFNVTCRPLKAGELASLERLIMPEYVTVKVVGDPYYGTWERTCYVNNTSAKYLIRKKNGEQWWGGITFPIIEV